MKQILATALLAFSLTAGAQVAELPASLGKTMKAMSTDLKAIAAQVNDASQNENSAALADQFVALTLHAKDFPVDSIGELPADQQAVAQAAYDKMLDDAALTGQQLAAALRAGDNASAARLLQQLNQDKHDGHDRFKKD